MTIFVPSLFSHRRSIVRAVTQGCAAALSVWSKIRPILGVYKKRRANDTFSCFASKKRPEKEKLTFLCKFLQKVLEIKFFVVPLR